MEDGESRETARLATNEKQDFTWFKVVAYVVV
jgi:hypothetical protein